MSKSHVCEEFCAYNHLPTRLTTYKYYLWLKSQFHEVSELTPGNMFLLIPAAPDMCFEDQTGLHFQRTEEWKQEALH